MARQNHGPLSRAKGKLGGVVYQQYEGMQISREYQPVVKNPQTTKQIENRAKFKNASQLTAVFSEVFLLRLSKLSIYKRERRGIAVNTLYRIANPLSTTEEAIVFNGAVDAINARTLTEYAAPTVSMSGTNFQVTAPQESVIFGVIAGFDSNGNVVARKVVNQAGTGSPVTFAAIPGINTQRAMFVYTLATTKDGQAIYDNIAVDQGNVIVEFERLVTSGDMAISDIAGISYDA